MKTLLKWGLLLICGVTILSSCSDRGIAYTKTVQDEYQLNAEDLLQMQFYLSSDITLKKSTKSGKSKHFDKKGQLIIGSSTQTKTIFVDQKTPGICIKSYSDNRLAISFFDDPDRILFFGDLDGNGKYRLLAKTWKDGKGEIEFDGDKYYIQPGSSSAYLEFRMAKYKTDDTYYQVARGKKVHN